MSLGSLTRSSDDVKGYDRTRHETFKPRAKVIAKLAANPYPAPDRIRYPSYPGPNAVSSPSHLVRVLAILAKRASSEHMSRTKPGNHFL